MAEDKTIILPDNSQHPGYAYPAFGGFGNGFGSFNSIADLFGLAIIASMFGWGGGNWGGFGGGFGGGAGAGFLSNQLNNDSGRELIMNAVTSQGEASRTAIQSLANMLGQDFNLVNGAVQNVQNALATIAANQGMNTLQVVNAIQNGNCQLASQFQQCCCENKLLVTSQGYENQLRTVEQTNTLGGAIADLKASMIDQFCGLEKREMPLFGNSIFCLKIFVDITHPDSVTTDFVGIGGANALTGCTNLGAAFQLLIGTVEQSVCGQNEMCFL